MPRKGFRKFTFPHFRQEKEFFVPFSSDKSYALIHIVENSNHFPGPHFGCGYLVLFLSFTREFSIKRFVTAETIWELPQKCGKRKNARNERETHRSYPPKKLSGNVENFFCGKPNLPVSACEISC